MGTTGAGELVTLVGKCTQTWSATGATRLGIVLGVATGVAQAHVATGNIRQELGVTTGDARAWGTSSAIRQRLRDTTGVHDATGVGR